MPRGFSVAAAGALLAFLYSTAAVGQVATDFAVVGANDLGMHCADQDYQVFSILPPFNVINAQVVRRANSGTTPRLMSGADVVLTYEPVANPADPVGPGSLNTTSANVNGVFKGNFWQSVPGTSQTLGGVTYRRLYPTQDKIVVDPATGQRACAPADALLGRCGSALDLFEPLLVNVGLPVPDPNELPPSGLDVLAGSVAQQKMPGAAGPQPFARFYGDRYEFFTKFPFGTQVNRPNWFAAEGIPILPTDDRGRANAYPMMRIKAVAAQNNSLRIAPGTVLGSTDMVVPVASEADCGTCHGVAGDSNALGVTSNGYASTFASVRQYRNGTAIRFASSSDTGVPGPEKFNNAAKINILRLHDAKHGDKYTSSRDGHVVPCMSGSEASCLDTRRAIQCSQCHYSPALDLAQVGPVDETTMGEQGRQQTRHISMSRAMHGHHADLKSPLDGSALFPPMPPPNARTAAQAQAVLNQTCYACHPGKRTQCLRDVMSSGRGTNGVGNVCQDCHGSMQQVGNDFTAGLPGGGGADLSKRVPWANEPKCQSCHVGDARTVTNTAFPPGDYLRAPGGIRLWQAFKVSDAGKDSLPLIQSANSRFAENQPLYRLSTGHGGVKCQACHGSTHSVWPAALTPDGKLRNDDVTSQQLQGHTGTVIECTVCHKPSSLGVNLNGPHGMHPVNDSRFVQGHENLAEKNKDACRACHGNTGLGTVLSRAAADRAFRVEDRTVRIAKGTPVRCNHCHENELN